MEVFRKFIRFGSLTRPLALFSQGKSKYHRKFCLPSLSEKDWKDLGLLKIIHNMKACPPYLIPSTLDNKRGICVPDYALAVPGSEAYMQKAGDTCDISPQFFLDFPQNFRLRTQNQYCTQAIA